MAPIKFSFCVVLFYVLFFFPFIDVRVYGHTCEREKYPPQGLVMSWSPSSRSPAYQIMDSPAHAQHISDWTSQGFVVTIRDPASLGQGIVSVPQSWPSFLLPYRWMFLSFSCVYYILHTYVYIYTYTHTYTHTHIYS